MKNTKKVPLTNSDKFATVDAEDYGWVSEFAWHLGKDGCAYTTIYDMEAGICWDEEMGRMVLAHAQMKQKDRLH